MSPTRVIHLKKTKNGESIDILVHCIAQEYEESDARKQEQDCVKEGDQP